MSFDTDINVPAYLIDFAENNVRISSNAELPKAETLNDGDKYRKHGQILMKSAVIKFIDIQKSISNAHHAEEYAREFEKYTDKFHNIWLQKELAKKAIPTTFPDPIPTFKDLRYKKRRIMLESEHSPEGKLQMR